MRNVTLADVKKEKFLTNFRNKIFYGLFMNDVSEAEAAMYYLKTHGFEPSKALPSEIVNNDGKCAVGIETSIILVAIDNSVSKQARIQYLADIIAMLKESKLNLSMRCFAVNYVNKYLVASNNPTDEEKKNMLKFFFSSEFSESEGNICIEDEACCVSQVKYDVREEDCCLNFIVTSLIYKDLMTVSEDELHNELEVTHTKAYRMWRNAVSVNVLKVMRGKK